jgi:hypothetical protein
MNSLFVRTAAGSALLGAIVLAPLTPAVSAPASLMQRMIALDGSVRSYTASIHADVTMHTFPFLNSSLDGTFYHQEPSMNKIVFTSGVPFIANAFSTIYPRIDSTSQWQRTYVVSIAGDTRGSTTFKLVPRKRGRIDHIDAVVDDKTAQLRSLQWNYSDGGYAVLNQTYGDVSGHELVTRQTGHLDVPHYDADLQSTFSHFKLNVAIPPSVFRQAG